MDLTYKQEVGVGALVIVGVALFLAGMFWLTGRTPGAEGARVEVLFTNISGLKQGDPVFVSGVKKGRVSRVALERVGSVRVTLELQRDVRPRLDASAIVTSLDFFGAKFVDYSPGTKDEFLPDGRAITGQNPPGLTDIAGGMATRANELLSNASNLVNEQLAVDIHNTMVATQRAMNLLAEAPEGPLVKQTTKALAATERLMNRLDSMLASGTGSRIDTLSANLAALTNHLGSATVAIDTMLRRMNRGEGSLGKLASDTSLYHDLHALSISLTALLTDLKEHPDKYVKPGLIRVRMF